MANITIPWNDGPGNIVLTYTGQGNQTVTVTSDTDCIDHDRQQVVTLVVRITTWVQWFQFHLSA